MQEDFWEPVYQDSPSLSDQLLLPNLVLDKNIYFLSAFAPSYIFKLLRDLASTKEIEPGYLDITYFVSGDLDLKSEGIVKLRRFLLEHADEQQVADFVGDALQLIAEGSLRLSIAYSGASSVLTKSCLGIIQDSGEEFVAFVDTKAGDFNSPVRLFRSWEETDYFEATKILENLNKVHGGKRANLKIVTGSETVSWLEYLHDWYEQNPPAVTTNINEDEPVNVHLLIDDERSDDEDIISFLSEFEELANEDSYEWLVDEPDEFDVSIFSDFGVVVDKHDAVDGHIPPLPEPVASLIGPASATCLCGHRFVRAYGCDQVLW